MPYGTGVCYKCGKRKYVIYVHGRGYMCLDCRPKEY